MDMGPSKEEKREHQLTWGLVILSIFCCCARADYNIICGCALLILLRNFYLNKKKLSIKISIHLLVIMSIFDLLWIFVCFSGWTHGDNTTDFWQSLSFIHNLVYLLVLGEFALKLYLAYLLFNQFKMEGETKDLLNFNYKETNQ